MPLAAMFEAAGATTTEKILPARFLLSIAHKKNIVGERSPDDCSD